MALKQRGRLACALMGIVAEVILVSYKHMDDRPSNVHSDTDDFNSIDNERTSIDSARSLNLDQLGDFDVNPPRHSEYPASDDDANFENFHVEFGTGVERQASLPGSRRVSSVVDDFSELSEYIEQPTELVLKDAVGNSGRSISLEYPPDNLDTEERQSSSRSPREKRTESVAPSPKDKPESHRSSASRPGSTGRASNVPSERPVTPVEGGSVSSKRGLLSNLVRRFGSKTPREEPEIVPDTVAASSDAQGDRGTDKERDRDRERDRDKERERRLRAMTSESRPVKRKYLTPAAVISQYAKGKLTNSEAMDAIMKFRVNKMLPKKVDGVYMDKDEIIIPKGYSFSKHRKSGSKKRRGGLTRIEREIRAYQESTQMLIPRSIFARIVREIAQGWFKGDGQIKFTVEALAALQVATEDEIIRLMEISTACSYHAKRITLRVDDMRLARFCRGRQAYEFSNIN